jgi:hypothetical protein
MEHPSPSVFAGEGGVGPRTVPLARRRVAYELERGLVDRGGVLLGRRHVRSGLPQGQWFSPRANRRKLRLHQRARPPARDLMQDHARGDDDEQHHPPAEQIAGRAPKAAHHRSGCGAFAPCLSAHTPSSLALPVPRSFPLEAVLIRRASVPRCRRARLGVARLTAPTPCAILPSVARMASRANTGRAHRHHPVGRLPRLPVTPPV